MDNNNTDFLKFAESLKLVRKYKIEEFIENKNIDDIYTDLLPNNGVISKLNLPRTTILVGRKGTGKSTIFQKSQKDLISNRKCISIYIDVKSLYDNSTPDIPDEVKILSAELYKYLIYSNLIKEIIIETKNRLDDFVQVSIIKKLLGFDLAQIDQINERLNEIESSINDVIKHIDGSLIQTFKQTNQNEETASDSLKLDLSKDPKLSISSQDTKNATIKTEFERTLVSYLDIKKSLISKLKEIKNILNIDHLYIFLDDFSEINEDAQKIFMDWFIAPLNNLSDDFIKFKIAVYPNRFYYGKLDNSKIDEISLEFFDAFYTFEKQVDIPKMEILALDYTKRLLKKRLDIFFPNNHWERFFEMSEDKLFDILFSVSFNNPRKIGYILSYCYESCLIHNSKISIKAIEKAAHRYFNDITLKYFLANQYVMKPFEDKTSNEHQYELLNKIIARQKINALSTTKSQIYGKPTNHFVVNQEISNLLDNLELNGFITTYNKTYDNLNQLSIIYSLDFGLCQRNALNFMRAKSTKLFTYFSQIRFNMNILISDYFNQTQIIRCNNGHEFPYEMLDTLKRFRMRCPDCLDDDKKGICEITLSSNEIREKLKSIESKRLKSFSYYEFQILDYLNSFNKVVSINRMSITLDKSETTVKLNIEKLIAKDFVYHDLVASRAIKKEVYGISPAGRKLVMELLDLINIEINKE